MTFSIFSFYWCLQDFTEYLLCVKYLYVISNPCIITPPTIIS